MSENWAKAWVCHSSSSSSSNRGSNSNHHNYPSSLRVSPLITPYNSPCQGSTDRNTLDTRRRRRRWWRPHTWVGAKFYSSPLPHSSYLTTCAHKSYSISSPSFPENTTDCYACVIIIVITFQQCEKTFVLKVNLWQTTHMPSCCCCCCWTPAGPSRIHPGEAGTLYIYIYIVHTFVVSGHCQV